MTCNLSWAYKYQWCPYSASVVYQECPPKANAILLVRFEISPLTAMDRDNFLIIQVEEFFFYFMEVIDIVHNISGRSWTCQIYHQMA